MIHPKNGGGMHRFDLKILLLSFTDQQPFITTQIPIIMIKQLAPALVSILIAAMLFIFTACKKEGTMKDIQPPDAKKQPKELTIHGDTRIDNYYWLNQRDNQEVIDYLKAENEYTEAVMKPTEDLQDALFQEMKGRIKEDDQSVPYLKNGYYYYSRYEEGKQYPIYCRKKGSLEAEEEVMLDVNEMAADHGFYQVTGLS